MMRRLSLVGRPTVRSRLLGQTRSSEPLGHGPTSATLNGQHPTLSPVAAEHSSVGIREQDIQSRQAVKERSKDRLGRREWYGGSAPPYLFRDALHKVHRAPCPLQQTHVGMYTDLHRCAVMASVGRSADRRVGRSA